MSIDPKQLTTETDDEWLRELSKEYQRLSELQQMFETPGWKHLELMLAAKESMNVEALLAAKDFEGVRAQRGIVLFVRWLRNLPLNTAAAAELRAETLEEHREDDELGE